MLIIDVIAAVLTTEPQLTTAIAAQVDQTYNKVGALLRQMMATHDVTQVDVKVKGKSPQKAWFVAAPDAD